MRNSLEVKTAAQVVEEAKKVIEEGRTGEQMALFSRHDKIKAGLLGGWRFNNIYVIAGASGSGKSYYLNMLYQDFMNTTLNAGFKKPFKIIHFGFEMTAYDEVIRAASSNTQNSYRKILSVDEILPDSQYNQTIAYLEKYKEFEIYYVESTGNCSQIEQTVLDFQAKFPQHELVVGMDHTLLADYEGEGSEVELVSNIAKMMLRLRKKIGIMGLEITQLNADIEEIERINNAAHHYPKKKDLHGSKAIFQCADYVIVLHAPEKLGIQKYGIKRLGSQTGYPTEKLIAWHLIKARKGTPGLIRLKDELYKGNIAEWTEEDDAHFGIVKE
jgi:replicative DNA helicase